MSRHSYSRVRSLRSGRSRFAVVSFAVLLPLAVFALPPMLPLEQRAAGSEIVIVAQVSDVRRVPFNEISESVTARVKVEQTLKGATPPEFELAFLVFPQTFEKHLRKPMGNGRYILFLNNRTVIDADGNTGEAIVLFEPRPFAFFPYNEQSHRELEEIIAASS